VRKEVAQADSIADPRVASAIANWAPRFTTNGVTVGDFQRITSGLERWDDWCEAWSRVGAEHEQLGRDALAQGRALSAGEHLAQAAVYYHFGKFLFVEDLDQMRRAHGRAVRCHTDALPHLARPGERVEIPFEGARLVAVLRRPAGDGPHPVVLLIPGLDSTKEELRSTEDTFLARGLATFSVDGPGQGEAEYDLPIRADWSAPAEALLETLAGIPDLDTGRLAVWGVSLGGYYAPRAAAFEPRLRAIAAISGPYEFGERWDQLPPLTREAFLVKSGARDEREAEERARALSLRNVAARITQPALFVTGGQDRIVPWRETERAAREAPHGTFVLFEHGSHVCSNVPYLYRPLVADWMAEQLAP
jgi:2,6-dihydroxypseudooxynicotine hydrolase